MVKQSFIISAFLACSTLPFSATSLANDILDSEASPFVGLRGVSMNTDSDRFRNYNEQSFPYRSGFEHFGLGVQFGVEFDNQFQIRSYFDRIRLNVSDNAANAWGHSYGADLLYRFDSGVFIGPGLNNTRTNAQRNATLRGTIGYRYNLLDRFFTSIEYSLQQSSDFTDQHVVWSLNYRLGRDVAEQTLPREFRERRAERQARAGSPTTQANIDSPATNSISQTRTEPPTPGSDEAMKPYRQPPASLNFPFNSSILESHLYGAVGRIADTLHEHPELNIVLVGHSDLTGDQGYNLWLSERRAAHIANLLIQDFSIDGRRIRVRGVGVKDPVVDAVGAPANAQNRRVEVMFTQS